MSKPTKKQYEIFAKLAESGCIVCGNHANIHHCGTGMGGRKDHNFVIPLCYFHHQGEQGIHKIGRKAWQELYGTERELHILAMEKINADL